jgi:hypothetical protein
MQILRRLSFVRPDSHCFHRKSVHVALTCEYGVDFVPGDSRGNHYCRSRLTSLYASKRFESRSSARVISLNSNRISPEFLCRRLFWLKALNHQPPRLRCACDHMLTAGGESTPDACARMCVFPATSRALRSALVRARCRARTRADRTLRHICVGSSPTSSSCWWTRASFWRRSWAPCPSLRLAQTRPCYFLFFQYHMHYQIHHINEHI